MTLLTGGKGFIGSHVLVDLCARGGDVLNIDAETYAARPPLYLKKPENLIEERVDIRDRLAVKRIMDRYQPDTIVHMAAESHVCRSIAGPSDFMHTNIIGTFNLIEEFRSSTAGVQFIHVSTDEVYGEIEQGHFSEDSPVSPRNPYAASKASSDLIVKAYQNTYDMNVVIVRMANNFGPNQHSEKLVPNTIRSILEGRPVLLHGNGSHVRHWLYVRDASRGIMAALDKGKAGQTYNLPGEIELTNVQMSRRIYDCVKKICPASSYGLSYEHKDARPKDDKRYAMVSKYSDLQWDVTPSFESKLMMTVRWYVHAMLHGGCRSPHGWSE